MLLAHWRNGGQRRYVAHPDEMLKAVDTALKDQPKKDRTAQEVAELARRHIAVPVSTLKTFVRSLSEEQRRERMILAEGRRRKTS